MILNNQFQFWKLTAALKTQNPYTSGFILLLSLCHFNVCHQGIITENTQYIGLSSVTLLLKAIPWFPMDFYKPYIWQIQRMLGND